MFKNIAMIKKNFHIQYNIYYKIKLCVFIFRLPSYIIMVILAK
jgi:hypothetical protein